MPQSPAEMDPATFASVEEALAELRAGRMVVVVDDADRENEGDLVCAAEFAGPEAVNFMATHGRGLICLALTGDRCDELSLPLMTHDNRAPFCTAFTVSIEASTGVTTGISAPDRARTIAVAIDPASGADDVVQPGHIFPLRARPGGVLERAGHTEASVDLATLAGLRPAGVICEILRPDGTMARVPELIEFCSEHGLKLVTIADLIAYRRTHQPLVRRAVCTVLPTAYGTFDVVGYESLVEDREHVALVLGDVGGHDDVLVRLHSQCLTGDVFHSMRCDCGQQLDTAMRTIADAGRGVLLYLDQEGRGIGLLNKLRAYRLQDAGLDTVDANLELGLPVDSRDFGIGTQILEDLGIAGVRLLTNNPHKVAALQARGMMIKEQVPLVHAPNPHNRAYLETKSKRLGHRLEWLPGQTDMLAAGQTA